MAVIPLKKSSDTKNTEKSRARRPELPKKRQGTHSFHTPTFAEHSTNEAREVLAIAGLAIVKTVTLIARSIVFYLIRHPLHAIITATLLFLVMVLADTGRELHNQFATQAIRQETIDKIIDASKYTRQFDIRGMARRGKLEFHDVGAPEWGQREAILAVLSAARSAGLPIEDQAVLLATVEVESGFNPMAKAVTTSACGLFQFVRATGKRYGLKQADCMNPWKNAIAGVAHYRDNFAQRVAPKVQHLSGSERVMKSYELTYYMHHDGPNSTVRTNEVKATILSGTQFLLASYNVLLEEQHAHKSAQSFGERFQENLNATLNRLLASF